MCVCMDGPRLCEGTEVYILYEDTGSKGANASRRFFIFSSFLLSHNPLHSTGSGTQTSSVWVSKAPRERIGALKDMLAMIRLF